MTVNKERIIYALNMVDTTFRIKLETTSGGFMFRAKSLQLLFLVRIIIYDYRDELNIYNNGCGCKIVLKD